MQRLFFSFLIVGVIWIVRARLRACDHMGTLLYEDLGCRPYFEEEDSPCPSQFSCNPFNAYTDTCLFRGKKYQRYEKIDDGLIMENCFYDCVCANPTGTDKYRCSVRNCTEWSMRYNNTVCYQKYVADQCCAVGTVCTNRVKDIYECKFEGRIYREGELFTPANSCSRCSCRKGFRGIAEAPFCKRNLCATQVVDYEELENYCAPLYLPRPGETALCCPNDWVCHAQNDTIITIRPSIGADTIPPCIFGPKTVKVGEGLTKNFTYFGMDLTVICECAIPPLMTCKAAQIV